MFGYIIEGCKAYRGWRAILYQGHVDILPDRQSSSGEESDLDMLVDWANSGPWKRMLKWAKHQSGSSRDTFTESCGDYVLSASPQASYGYLYIGLGMLDSALVDAAEPA